MSVGLFFTYFIGNTTRFRLQAFLWSLMFCSTVRSQTFHIFVAVLVEVREVIFFLLQGVDIFDDYINEWKILSEVLLTSLSKSHF
jgi:hypothetical protein